MSLLACLWFALFLFPCSLHAGMCACSVTSVMSNSLQLHWLEPTKLLCPWDSPSKNTGVSWHALSRSFQPRDWTDISCVSIIAGRFFTAKPPGKPSHCPLFHPNLLCGMSQEDSLTEFWSAAPASDTASDVSHLCGSDSSWYNNSIGLGSWKSLGHLSPTCPSWQQGDPGHLLEPALQSW